MTVGRTSNVPPYPGQRDREFPYEHVRPTAVTLDFGHVTHFKPPVHEPGKPCWCWRYERYADVLGG